MLFFCHGIFLSLSSFPVFFFYRCLVKYLRNVCTSKFRDIFIKYILSFHSFSSVSTINLLVHVTDYFLSFAKYTRFHLAYLFSLSHLSIIFRFLSLLFSSVYAYVFSLYLSPVYSCTSLFSSKLDGIDKCICISLCCTGYPKSIKCTVNICRYESQSTHIPKHIVLNIFCHLLRSWNDFRKFNIISDHTDNINVLQIINHIRSI